MNWTGLEFPTSVKHIEKLVKQNADVVVYIFSNEIEGKDEYVYPLRISGLQRARVVVNVMLISDDEKNHYC